MLYSIPRTILLTGFPFYVAVITLPEWFQIVNSRSSVAAGIGLLPLLGASAVGSAIGGAVSNKKNRTSFTLVAASGFQLLGVGPLSNLSDSAHVPPSQYGCQVLLGLGLGMAVSTATIMTAVQADRHDHGTSLFPISVLTFKIHDL